MNRAVVLIGSLGLGAGLMYLLDPEMGSRRRALVRDKATHAMNKTGDAIDATARDLRYRTRGLVAEARSRLTSEQVSDEVLVERVRSKLGRVVSHPHSIEVAAKGGRVTLSGPVLAREASRLLSAVSSVRGVTGIEDRLETHERPGDVPGLQGGVARRGERFGVMQVYWSPTTRLLVGAAGSALTLYGAGRRDLPGTAVGLAGLAMLARALTNLEMTRLVGIGAGRAVHVRKTITIAAPVERVFEFWSDYENFPRFMGSVRAVEDTGEGRSHWTVAGPAGAPVEWDAVVTERVPNEVLAWKTAPGSVVEHAGIVHFQRNADDTTRVDVEMSYSPPAGAAGHVVASLFGADPKSEMDEDLVRMKTLIETEGGRPTAARARVEHGAR